MTVDTIFINVQMNFVQAFQSIPLTFDTHLLPQKREHVGGIFFHC